MLHGPVSTSRRVVWNWLNSGVVRLEIVLFLLCHSLTFRHGPLTLLYLSCPFYLKWLMFEWDRLWSLILDWQILLNFFPLRAPLLYVQMSCCVLYIYESVFCVPMTNHMLQSVFRLVHALQTDSKHHSEQWLIDFSVFSTLTWLSRGKKVVLTKLDDLVSVLYWD